MNDVGADRVQKDGVVAHNQRRAVVLDQEGLQPQGRAQVQMVGGLVEQQDVGVGKEGLGKR